MASAMSIERKKNYLPSLLKNSRPLVAPWKSGASAPRKAFKINPGFSPSVRLSRRRGAFQKTRSALQALKATPTARDVGTAEAMPDSKCRNRPLSVIGPGPPGVKQASGADFHS
jgi:hypothetical protein